jgi:hypothetical protein
MRHAMKWMSSAILSLVVVGGMTPSSAHAAKGPGNAPAPPAPAPVVLTTTLTGGTHGISFTGGTATLRTGDRLSINIDLAAANAALARIAANAVIDDGPLQVWVINPNALPVQIGTFQLVGARGSFQLRPLPAGVALGAGTTLNVVQPAGAGEPPVDPVLCPLLSGTF